MDTLKKQLKRFGNGMISQREKELQVFDFAFKGQQPILFLKFH
jgi:hypothetical protein